MQGIAMWGVDRRGYVNGRSQKNSEIVWEGVNLR